MSDLIKRLKKLGREANALTKGQLNYGGCAVYAALVCEYLVKLGYDARGVVAMTEHSGVDLDKARPAKAHVGRISAWNANGIHFNHVGFSFKSGRTTYVGDSDGVFTKTEICRKYNRSFCDFATPIKGSLFVDELKKIAGKAGGWNRRFNRRQIPELRSLVESRLAL